MVTFAGIESVRLTPVTAEADELLITIDNVEVPPLVMDIGENDLVSISGEVIAANRALVE